MLSAGKRPEEGSRCGGADASAEELIDFDGHRLGDDQLAPELRHERRGQLVSPVTAVRGRDERSRVGEDPQRAVTSSRR